MAKTKKPASETAAASVGDAAVQPLALNARQAAAALSISPRKLWELTNSGEIPHTRFGRKLVYPTEPLRRWLAARSQPRGARP